MNNPVVIRQAEQPPADVVAALGKFGVSTVHEAQGRCGLLATYMRPIYPGAAIAGPASKRMPSRTASDFMTEPFL